MSLDMRSARPRASVAGGAEGRGRLQDCPVCGLVNATRPMLGKAPGRSALAEQQGYRRNRLSGRPLWRIMDFRAPVAVSAFIE